MTDSIVGWSQIEALRELQAPDEPDVVAEVIKTFVSDSSERLARLREAAVDGNLRQIELEAHTLKGTAGVIGAESLRADADRVEQAAKASQITNLTALIDRLAASLDAVHKALLDGPPHT